MIDGILTLESGARSLKFSVFTLPASQNNDPHRVLQGVLAGIGGTGRINAWDERGHPVGAGELPADQVAEPDLALNMLLSWIRIPAREVRLIGVAHRIPHGGSRADAEIIDAALLTDLRSLLPMAPAGQAVALDGVEAVQRLLPDVAQIACFDTAFHAGMPEVARALPLPMEFRQRGVLRYGSSGLVFESIARRLATELKPASRRMVICLLGEETNLCAVRGDRSVATSSSFSPLGGLPADSRSGDLDPGVLLYLLRHEGYTVEQLERLLYRRSGLLGLSGFSHDLKVLLDSKFPRATVAVEQLCYRLIRELGSMTAALQGLDTLVFTGRLGMTAAPIRAAVCRNARWLGMELDPDANRRHARQLHDANSRIRIMAVPGEADWIMACHARKHLDSASDAVSGSSSR